MPEQGKQYLCKYQVGTLVFMMGEEKIIADPSNIMSIEKLDEFEFNIRAVLKVVLRIDIRKKMWIMKNKRDIVCKFELNKIGMDTEVEQYVTAPEPVWNKEFGIYFSDEDEAIDMAVFEERLAKNEDEDFASNRIDTENYFESQNLLDVYLFNQELLNASMNTFNGVFTSNTMQQIVGRVLTASKHPSCVLMSRFENDEVYEELLVPATPSYKALIYLEQYFGFYKKGAIIYYDVDTLYILNANGKLTAKKEDEWPETTFMVTRIDSSTPGNGMVRKQDEKVYYVSVPDMNVNPQKFSISTNAELGSEAKVVVTDDVTVDVEEADQSYIDQRNEFITYQRKDDNKYATTIMKTRMEENECILCINGDNLDMAAFTPNKVYQVVFEETAKQEKYGKFKYRLSYAYHMLKVESEGFMSSSHLIMLKRAGSDEVAEGSNQQGQ